MTPPSPSTPNPTPYTLHPSLLLAAAAGTIYLVLAVTSAREMSVTADETAHIGAGIAYWKTGDFRMNPEHPPLVKLLAAAVPLATMDVRFDVVRPSDGAVLGPWEDGEQNTFGNLIIYAQNNADRLLFRARLIPILIGLLGGWAAWWWGREFGGPWAGAAAAWLLLMYPEYLGHARYVTMDVPVATACALCGAALWRWWRRPTPARAAVFVVAAVAGVLVKIPVGVYLAGLGGCAFALAALRGRLGGRRGAAAVVVLFVATGLVLWAVAWAVYGFRFSLTASDMPPLRRPNAFLGFTQPAAAGGGLSGALHAVWRMRLVPEAFLAVFSHVATFEGRPTFLMGEVSRHGFLSYFFYTTLLKTPLLYLVLLALSFAGWARRLRKRPEAPRPRGRFFEAAARRNRSRALLFAVPYLVLLWATIVTRASIGHRYILFAYVPACVAMGCVVARMIAREARPWRFVGAAALAAALVIQLRAWPDHATFFNALGGDPLRASAYLVDSNVDWGQDLKRLGKYVRERGGGPINLAYFGTGDPRYYGVREFRQILPSYPFAINMPPYQPMRRDWPTAVSLNNLPSVHLLYPGEFDRPPEAVINSIVIFPPAAERGASPG